ncbi:MAG: hypothetical protein AAF587_44965 [Bacteroidota bacterium]
MAIHLKEEVIEKRLSNSNRGNCVDLNGAAIRSGEYVLHHHYEGKEKEETRSD